MHYSTLTAQISATQTSDVETFVARRLTAEISATQTSDVEIFVADTHTAETLALTKNSPIYSPPEGILPVNKPAGISSFTLVRQLRRHLGVKKIGHAGTLDPFATGVMVMLIGRNYTKLSDRFLNQNKEYIARLRFGSSTDTYDCEGEIVNTSSYIPSLNEVKSILQEFQGEIDQVPPMFSAKKQNGKKLYELARRGETVERQPVKVTVTTEILDYTYPYLDIRVSCSKGTYIRSIGHEIGEKLGCWAHLEALNRTKSGQFVLADCIDGKKLESKELNVLDLYNNLCNTEGLLLK